MATRKTAPLDGGLIARKGAAVPAQAAVATRAVAEMPDTPRAGARTPLR